VTAREKGHVRLDAFKKKKKNRRLRGARNWWYSRPSEKGEIDGLCTRKKKGRTRRRGSGGFLKRSGRKKEKKGRRRLGPSTGGSYPVRGMRQNAVGKGGRAGRHLPQKGGICPTCRPIRGEKGEGIQPANVGRGGGGGAERFLCCRESKGRKKRKKKQKEKNPGPLIAKGKGAPVTYARRGKFAKPADRLQAAEKRRGVLDSSSIRGGRRYHEKKEKGPLGSEKEKGVTRRSGVVGRKGGDAGKRGSFSFHGQGKREKITSLGREGGTVLVESSKSLGGGGGGARS